MRNFSTPTRNPTPRSHGPFTKRPFSPPLQQLSAGGSSRSHAHGPFTKGPHSPPLHALRTANPGIVRMRNPASDSGVFSARNVRMASGAAVAYGLYSLWSNSDKRSEAGLNSANRNLAIALVVLGGATFVNNG